MLKKGEAKLSQFAGVVLLILFFIFSMLYLMIFQSVDDIMKATLSVKQQLVSLRCGGILNSFLSAEYYKPNNDHLFTVECSSFGRNFIPYNSTHCINMSNQEDRREGKYDIAKSNAFIITSWYTIPRMFLTPNCEEIKSDIYFIFIVSESGGILTKLEDVLIVDKTVYDNAVSTTGQYVVQEGDQKIYLEDSTRKVFLYNTTGTYYLNMIFDKKNVVITHETNDNFNCTYLITPDSNFILDNVTHPVSGDSELLGSLGLLPNRISNMLKGGNYLVGSKALELCVERVVGECGIGIPLPKKDYYYFNEKLSLLNHQLSRVGTVKASGGIVKGFLSLPSLSATSEYCETPIFSIEQTGKIIKKGILDAKAYIVWG